MEFGRKVSFTGQKVKLELNLRNSLYKNHLRMLNIGTVKIYDKDPAVYPCGASLIATLTPQIYGEGQLYVIWDIPLDLPQGKYVDVWEGLSVEGLSTPFRVSKQFFVSTNSVSFEKILKSEYEVDMDPCSIYSDTCEYITFKLLNPEGCIFPPCEARLISTHNKEVRFKLDTVNTGPGEIFVTKTNDLSQERVVLAEVSVTSQSEFFKIHTFEDTAYFLLDTQGVAPGMYQVQLKLITGEVKKVLRPFGLLINSSNLNDGSPYFNEFLSLV